MVLRSLLPLLLVLLLPLDLQAWGREGHRLIAEIAERRLNQKARDAVAALLGPGETLQSVSAWADEVRSDRKETSTWHYINIPLTAPKGDYRTYCPAAGCVAGIIGEMESRLRNASLSRKERYEALKFLVHFVGDLHQPLHCGDRGDRGGNDVPVVFQNRPTNLHSVWDTPMLEELERRDPSLKARLGRGPGSWTTRRMRGGGPADWVWDAHAISRDVAYANLPAGRPAVLDETYLLKAKPAIETQIQRGGVRLALMLNNALGR